MKKDACPDPLNEACAEMVFKAFSMWRDKHNPRQKGGFNECVAAFLNYLHVQARHTPPAPLKQQIEALQNEQIAHEASEVHAHGQQIAELEKQLEKQLAGTRDHYTGHLREHTAIDTRIEALEKRQKCHESNGYMTHRQMELADLSHNPPAPEKEDAACPCRNPHCESYHPDRAKASYKPLKALSAKERQELYELAMKRSDEIIAGVDMIKHELTALSAGSEQNVKGK